MRKWLPLVVLSLSTIPARSQVSTRSLNDGWEFTETGKEQWLPAEVPGVVHTDLMRNDRIPDPYLDRNVDSVQWVEQRDWSYRRTFDIGPRDLEHEQIDLVFKGLDTYTEVTLNDSVLGRTDNMFRVWTFPIKDLLRVGENQLQVRFRSPLMEGAKVRDRYLVQLPHDSDPSGIAPYVRKAAYQFGWDFAPRLVSCGIWQPVELSMSGSMGHITASVATTWSGNALSVVVQPSFVRRPKTFGTRMLVTRVYLDGELMARKEVSAGTAVLPALEFNLEQPALWWPNGEGEQFVHLLRIELRSDDDLISTYERPLGLREVRLDRTADEIGEPFRFLINGRPVFMRGCNLVPPDMFLPRGGDSAWVALVKDMAEAHMNMVRVWSGGVYPPDAFFTACDTAGILVWQDLMFGYMAPGSDSIFLRSVTEEIRQQVDRIAEHPSLALFCGNNELDVAWHNWGWQQRYGIHGADSARVRQDHRQLFEVLLPALIAPHNYTTTSPLSNWGSASGLLTGDLHYWGVWHGDSTFASFKGNVGRFVSEYGFQSYPDSASLARYIDPGALYMGSPAVTFRQRSYRTDAPILQAIERELNERPITLGQFIEASQQVQALAYELAIKAHWKARPHCMGTLLWQLNEPWPGPSWSIIEHGGGRKPAYFSVRKQYEQMMRSAPMGR